MQNKWKYIFTKRLVYAMAGQCQEIKVHPSASIPQGVYFPKIAVLCIPSHSCSMMTTLLHWEAGCLFPLLESNGLLYLPQPIELNKWYFMTSRLDHTKQFGFHLGSHSLRTYVLGDYRWHLKNLAPLRPLCWRYQWEKLHRVEKHEELQLFHSF